MTMTKMSAAEFRDAGYLQEVNRGFLHPLGLAMYVNVETGEFGVLDSRADLEGWVFGSTPEHPLDLTEKAQNIARLAAERMPARHAALGYWVQPVPGIDHPGPWHPVTGPHPPADPNYPGYSVDVWVTDGHHIRTGYRTSDGAYTVADDDLDDPVTHWAPLTRPALPGEVHSA